MGTFEGLGVPRYGAYTRHSEDQTEVLSVEDDGVHNFTLTKDGTAADALFGFTVSDETTFATGYASVLYINHSNDGTKTGTSSSTSQTNMIAMDITLNDNMILTTGMYIYVMEGSDDGPGTNNQFTGIDIYIEELGQIDYLTCLWLEKNNTTAATSADCFILCNQHSGTTTSLIRMQGTHPVNFLTTASNPTAGGSGFVSACAMTQTSSLFLRCTLGTAVLWIKAGSSA